MFAASVVLPLTVLILGQPPFSHAALGPLASPGSVNAIISYTKGNPDFATRAEAAGWPRTAAITVEYDYFERPTTHQKWVKIDHEEHTCPAPTSQCEAPDIHREYWGWVKVEAEASGAGGDAENNPSVRTAEVG